MALSFESCDLPLFLFADPIFLLLLKDFLELLNCAVVLVSELLELGVLLLLLFALAGAIILFLLAKDLVHEILCRLARVVEQLLAILDDLGCRVVLEVAADGQGSVTIGIALEEIDLGVLDNVLKYIFVSGVLCSQVHNSIIGHWFAHMMIHIFCEELLDALDVGIRPDEAKHQWSEILHLRLEGAALGAATIAGLHRLDVDLHRIELAEDVLHDFSVAMEGSGTDNIADYAVLVALAEADVTNVGQLAASSDEYFHDLDIASDGCLDDEGSRTIELVLVLVLLSLHGWDCCGRLR